jgi:hypothetical protein
MKSTRLNIDSPKLCVEGTKCFQMPIYIKLAPFVARRKHSMKSIVHIYIYIIYLRLATISQLTNIRLRQNAKYFAHVNKT